MAESVSQRELFGKDKMHYMLLVQSPNMTMTMLTIFIFHCKIECATQLFTLLR
jgi:hypothetical protein